MRELKRDRLTEKRLRVLCIDTHLTRINTILSARLQNMVPRLNAPAAMPPTPEITIMLPPPSHAISKISSEEEEEMAKALRQDLANSFESSPYPFGFLDPPAPEPAASQRLTNPNVAAAPDGGEFSCEHCGKTFMSPYAVNGHKTHSKECSAKGRKPSLGA